MSSVAEYILYCVNFLFGSVCCRIDFSFYRSASAHNRKHLRCKLNKGPSPLWLMSVDVGKWPRVHLWGGRGHSGERTGAHFHSVKLPCVNIKKLFEMSAIGDVMLALSTFMDKNAFKKLHSAPNRRRGMANLPLHPFKCILDVTKTLLRNIRYLDVASFYTGTQQHRMRAL